MKRILKILGIIAVLLSLGIPARADEFCGAGSTCTIDLSQTNTIQLEGVVVSLTIDNAGANTELSFQLTSNPLSNTPLGIDMVGWNTGGVPTPPGGWSSFTAGTMDGFGTFQFQSQDSAGTDGILTPVTFTLNGLVTNFADNANSNEFAVHVRFDSNTSCSGFVGGVSEWGGSDSSSGCTPVPEPATLTLFGTGLIVLGGKLRRKLVKR